MAFTVSPAVRGKHRRARRGPGRTGATLAGVAALTAVGAFGATAAAAPGQSRTAASAGGIASARDASAPDAAFARAVSVGEALTDAVAEQADAQREAAAAEQRSADKARADARAVRVRAEAAARAKVAAAARASRAASRRALAAAWTRPVGDAPIGTPYREAGAYWSSGYHTGVDFLVPIGTTVHAVAVGTVVSAGWDGSYGNDVIIRHADGKYTLYGHLTRPLVAAGQRVAEGEAIGVSGATGNVTGPHMHFEVRTGPDYGSDIDPVAYLRSHGVTL
ncbi:M23 family metallopeptidase [Streptomyces sp. HPF1205]|uniref:M23 family metallopeptidase n=1 Tax=Streptomyces sp. HPF1205 TaxID=2873262 RepID=UPI001CEC6DD2|nr:M23 family metallopeptidase [Streptomyces sp. HPF1205]